MFARIYCTKLWIYAVLPPHTNLTVQCGYPTNASRGNDSIDSGVCF